MTLQALTESEEEILNSCYELMRERDPSMPNRFGIWRIHEHFQKKDDEVFHETSNAKTRESTLRIVPKHSLPKNAFPSTWKLTDNGPVVATWCCDGPTIRPIP